MPLNIAQTRDICLLYSPLFDSFLPDGIGDVQSLKNSQQRKTADLGQVNQRSGIRDSGP
jgi:hypothetical protein